MYVERQNIDLNDYTMNIGNLLIDEETGFNTQFSSQRTLPYLDSKWNAITYEMSLTRTRYERTVYSFLDVLRDVGGLFSSLV